MPNMDIDQFLKEDKQPKSLRELAMPLVSQLNFFCEENDLVGAVEADLICIRCSSSEVYDGRRTDIEDKSSYMFQSLISDRRVSFFKLEEIIPSIIGNIEYLELCDQKPDGSQDDRISHIAIVPVSSSYEEVLKNLMDRGVEVEETIRPHYTSADITLPSGFTIRLAKEFLVDKIKREELI